MFMKKVLHFTRFIGTNSPNMSVSLFWMLQLHISNASRKKISMLFVAKNVILVDLSADYSASLQKENLKSAFFLIIMKILLCTSNKSIKLIFSITKCIAHFRIVPLI